MAITQRKFREIVFQLLFSQEVNKEFNLENLSVFLDQWKVTKKTAYLAYERVRMIDSYRSSIDQLIQEEAKGYAFSRISFVEKNILRLGVFELVFDDQVPSKVAIAEAIRLTRKFGTPEGGTFVNAVLDGVYQKKESRVCEYRRTDHQRAKAL